MSSFVKSGRSPVGVGVPDSKKAPTNDDQQAPVGVSWPQLSAVSSNNRTADTTINTAAESNTAQNVLGTALFRLKSDSGQTSLQIRGMCDNGSQLNLISKECVQRLQLPQIPSDHVIVGAGIGTEIVSSSYIEGILCHGSLSETFGIVKFHVLAKISCNQPQGRIDCDVNGRIASDQLADPYFGTPARMDALIGVGAWASIVRDGVIRFANYGGDLIAQNSALGWVICGSWDAASTRTYLSYHVNADIRQDEINLERFWEVDEKPMGHVMTEAEQRAESNFIATHQRSNGHYIVTIPFIPSPPSLGVSRHTAIKRLLTMEARMAKDEELAVKCREFFQDYLNAGHMIPAAPVPSEFGNGYYIPYHAIRAKKFRVVFDGSCKSSSGISVNDLQLTGPKLQADLGKTLLAFRMHRYAITADIVKMFRQVQVCPEHWNYQRVLWRPSSDHPIMEYVLTCVVWGFTSATYNAVRALRQCAVDNSKRYPLASRVALSCFYVDDLLTGCEEYKQLCAIRTGLIEMLALGGFPISKWTTNHPRLAKELGQSTAQEVAINSDTGVLGMSWQPHTDMFRLNLDNYDRSFPEPMTKRQVISRIAKVYDPSGLFTPVVVHGKMIIQDLWRLKIGWDQLVPSEIMERWRQLHSSIVDLATITVPRWNAFSPKAKVEWHVFCDASEGAYGACIYLRTDLNGIVQTHLVSSRSRVAPVKQLTIPRLELLGAVMAIELWAYVSDACQLEHIPGHFWTDSMIVLHWLAKDCRSLKPFVANRVSTILKSSALDRWHHTPGEQNPADLVSRGTSVQALRASTDWWNGPRWLSQTVQHWPKTLTTVLSEQEQQQLSIEAKASLVGVVVSPPTTVLQINNAVGEPQTLLARATSLNGLVRATGFVFRYINKFVRKWRKSTPSYQQQTESSLGPEQSGALTVAERQLALNYWIVHEQKSSFGREAQALQSQITIPSNSKLLRYTPLMDSDGIVRMGGRLRYAKMDEDMKHPTLIPQSSALAELIVRDAHHQALHGGVQLTMVVVRQKYWIPSLRAIVKKVVRSCTSCIRYRKETAMQLMADLPSVRVNAALPFVVTGLDFAGPFLVRRTPGRPPRGVKFKDTPPPPTVDKVWVTVFVCMATHAIHLDITHGLSVEAFLETFARFISRRGHCRELWSDNGTTFVGTNKELQRVLAEWKHKLPTEELSNLGTTWRFSTPGSPHQGGIWEAGVKAFKQHFRRTVGDQKLTPNQLYTVLTRIEACLNSRPIVPLSDDPSDLQVLTPGHFIAGRPLLQRPLADDVEHVPDNRLTNWGRCQKLMQTYWRRWKEEHLVSLQARTKWPEICQNLKLNDIVIALDENSAPASWPLGRVVVIHPSSDGLIRNVTIRTQTRYLRRSIHKIVALYRNPDDDGQVDPRLLPRPVGGFPSSASLITVFPST